jgi:hypothetical protein
MSMPERSGTPLLDKLDSWMLKKNTDQLLRQTILLRLREWHHGEPPSPVPWDCPFREALQSQDAIGWYPLLLGHVSHHWKDVQQAYYTSLSLDNTGKQWVCQFILQLFNVSWDLWEHRNGIKHNTVTPAKRRKLDAVNALIRDEFVTGPTQLLPRDRRWFAESPDSLIQKYSLVEKNQWLASVACARWRCTRRRSILQATQEAQRHAFHLWLHPPPPTS